MASFISWYFSFNLVICSSCSLSIKINQSCLFSLPSYIFLTKTSKSVPVYRLIRKSKFTRVLSRCYTRHFSCNLSRNFVAPLRHKLHGSLPSVTCPEMNVSRNVFVAVTVARSRTNFYFSQRLREQKQCETCSFQGMLHLATIRATCVATKLREKLQEKLPSTTGSET